MTVRIRRSGKVRGRNEAPSKFFSAMNASEPEKMWTQLAMFGGICVVLLAGKTVYSACVNRLAINGEYNAKLFGTYHLYKTNRFDAVITGGPRLEPVQVKGNVAYYAVKEPYITGLSTKDFQPAEWPAEEGFFLIDGAKGTIKEGMSEKEWKEKLSQIGWLNPHLEEPPWGLFQMWRL